MSSRETGSNTLHIQDQAKNFTSLKDFNHMKKNSPKIITELKENQIFVFGSNLSGVHGAGAAKQAMNWGARWGQAVGRQGQTYAIPTKDKTIYRSLTHHELIPFVLDFVDYARNNPELEFLVTEIGCGLAGNTPEQIAPLFKDTIFLHNVLLPERFSRVLQKESGGSSLENEMRNFLEFVNKNTEVGEEKTFFFKISKKTGEEKISFGRLDN